MIKLLLFAKLFKSWCMWSSTACEDPWTAQVVAFPPRPWQQTHGLLLEIIKIWFLELLLCIGLEIISPCLATVWAWTEKHRSKTFSPPTVSNTFSFLLDLLPVPKEKWLIFTILTWGGWACKRYRLQGWERVSLGAAGWTEWVCVVLGRIQDSQRHHCSDWWRTPWRSLFLFREGGKRQSGLCLSKQTWKGASSFWNGLQSFSLAKMIIVSVKPLDKIVSHVFKKNSSNNSVLKWMFMSYTW